MTEHITTQIITATINLAGRQVVTVDTHGTGGPGSMITVRIGAALIHLHDRMAVRTYADAWTAEGAPFYARNLPAATGGVAATVAAEPVVAIVARGMDKSGSSSRNGALVVRIGRFYWVALDREAYEQQVAIWDTVRALADLTLPLMPRH